MTKASTSFLLFLLLVFLTSFQSFAQTNGNMISEQVELSTRSNERLRLTDLLRLSLQEEQELSVTSLTILAQHLGQGTTQIHLTSNGQILATETIRKNLKEVKIQLSSTSPIRGLELSSPSEVFISSISAEVTRLHFPQGPGHQGPGHQGPGHYGPGPSYGQQVTPQSVITLSVQQHVRGRAIIPIDELVRQQLGLSLEGAQIQRVVVIGQPGFGPAASVQVELNRRLVGRAKYISRTERTTPLPVQSLEEVRSLNLLVSGEAQIFEIRIRVGEVRPRYDFPPQIQRYVVQRQISSVRPFMLSQVTGHQNYPVRSITIEARAQFFGQTELRLRTLAGEFQGRVFINQGMVRVTLPFSRMIYPQELVLEALNPLVIEAIELQ